MSTSVGGVIAGRYRLEERIGHGGMSSVYRAVDLVLERSVAIKIMDSDGGGDADQLERFRREARAVARLNHPHIVTVIDAGEDGHVAYIVFEYVPGENLKARIRRKGPLPIGEAIAYALDIARGLAAAHEQDIVHRDVKPQNVLLDGEGGAKITDFGIARTLTEEGLTGDGRVLGTTDYVSPEQALGHPVGAQSDIYSLGVVLYEMLAGDVPFHGDTPVTVAMKHVREELPDLQTRRAHVSATVAALVDRATAKDLSRRHADAPSLIADLEEALSVEAARGGTASGEATMILRALPDGRRRHLPLVLRHPARTLGILAALCVLAAAGVGVVLALNAERGTGVSPGAVIPPHLMPVSLGQDAAHDYNPFGTTPEDRNEVNNAIDGDPNTTWSTEHYYSGSLQKPGVGIYVDASPGVAVKDIEVQTPTPGFAAQVYGAYSVAPITSYGDPTPLRQRGWVGPLGQDSSVRSDDRIALADRGRRFRYYMLWITKLPPESELASIAELTLLR